MSGGLQVASLPSLLLLLFKILGCSVVHACLVTHTLKIAKQQQQKNQNLLHIHMFTGWKS